MCMMKTAIVLLLVECDGTVLQERALAVQGELRGEDALSFERNVRKVVAKANPIALKTSRRLLEKVPIMILQGMAIE